MGKRFNSDREMYRRQFTFVPETPVLYEELTLDEHLRLTAMAYGLEESVYNERITVLIKRISNGEKTEVVSCSFFKRNEAKSHDYVCFSCRTIPLYCR